MPESRADSGVGRGERSRDEEAIEDIAGSSLLGRTIDPDMDAPGVERARQSSQRNIERHGRPSHSPNEDLKTSTGNPPSDFAGSPQFRGEDSRFTSMESDFSRTISLKYHDQLDGNEADTSDDENLWLATSDSPPLETLDSVLSMGSASTSPLPLGVDSDEDILRPLEWINRLKSIEQEVLEKSFYWHQKPDNSQTYFSLKLLPTVCPVRCLDESWQQLCDLKLESESVDEGRDNSKHTFTQMTLADLVSLYVNFHLGDKAVTVSKLSRDREKLVYGPELDMMKMSLNILITLCRTIETIQQKGICTEGISIFVANRKSEVAWLESVKLSTIVELVQRLNCILRSVLWGLRNGYSTRHYSTGQMPDFRDNYRLIFDLECLQTMEQFASFSTIACLWWTIAQVLDIGVISYCGAHLVSTFDHLYAVGLHFGSGSFIELPNEIISVPKECRTAGLWPLHYAAVSLTCMNEFLHGKRVWVIQSPLDSPYSAHISTTIEDLADIWGPVWKLTEQTDVESETLALCYYGIGVGVIVRWPDDTDDLDGVSCHFLPSVAQLTPNHIKINASEKQRLLIGAHESGGLDMNLSCTDPQLKNLVGVRLIPSGTSESSSYQDSITYNLAIGYSGSQIGTSRQYKKRDGMTRKQRMLSRWRLEPEKRNADVLSLWCGLEVSACTKNARRRRLLHLVNSQTMLKHRQHGFFDWPDPTCKTAVEKAMGEEDPKYIIELYNKHVEWRKDIGRVVSWLFDALGDTGITPDGDLAAYSFMEDSGDPHQTAIYPNKVHTWTGFLKDTVLVATFAITTDACLEFPYSASPGQRCSYLKTDKPRFTVIETAIVPNLDVQVMESSTWSHHIPTGKYLSLESSNTEMLKLVARLPNKDLVVRWSDTKWVRGFSMMLPREFTTVRYREGFENTSCKAVRAYIISKNSNVQNPSVQENPVSNHIPQAGPLDVGEQIQYV